MPTSRTASRRPPDSKEKRKTTIISLLLAKSWWELQCSRNATWRKELNGVSGMAVQEQIWKKVLYDDQSVPDNYVDRSFLGQLRKNVNLVHFTLSEALYGVTGVVQQICRTALFAVLFGHLQDGQLRPMDLFVGLAMLGWPTYLLYAYVQQRTTAEGKDRG
ncbi:hypothetical protein V5799_011896 [Amblyomma americanum]|uniref:Uncharacterized protein n=1 Tax=Amblyomma americanum TaxID=6943 RepID=A0AAQ4EFX2_AMBAM